MKPKRFPDPFALTTDPRSYVPRVSTERVLREMEAEIDEGTTALLLAGPPGIGKTLMLHVLGERLEERFQPVYVPHGRLAAQELAAFLLGTLGAPPTSDPLAALLGLARSREQHRGQAGLRPLLVLIDDVGGAGIDALVELTAEGSAPRLVAVPASDEDAGLLRRKLADRARLVSLREPLNAAESSALVRRRLVHAGLPGSVIGRYDEAAIRELHAAAEGNPMALHALADAWLRRRARPVRAVQPEPSPEPARPELGAREIARASHPPRENAGQPTLRAGTALSAGSPVLPASPRPAVQPRPPATGAGRSESMSGTAESAGSPSTSGAAAGVSASTGEAAGPDPAPSDPEPTPPPPRLRAVPSVAEESEAPLRPADPVKRDERAPGSPPASSDPPTSPARPTPPGRTPGPPRVAAPVRKRPFEPSIRVRPRGEGATPRRPIAGFAAGLAVSLTLALWLLVGGGEEPILPAQLQGTPDAELAVLRDGTAQPPLAAEELAPPTAGAGLSDDDGGRAPELAGTAALEAPAARTADSAPAPVADEDTAVPATAALAPARALPPVSAPPPSRSGRAAPGAAVARDAAPAAVAAAPVAEETAVFAAPVAEETAGGAVPEKLPAEEDTSGAAPHAAGSQPGQEVEAVAARSQPEEALSTLGAPQGSGVSPAEPETAPAALPATVRVHINATPWAEIEVDGEPIGLTPLGNVEMTAGDHGFRAIFADGRVIDRTLTVGADSRRVSFDRAEAVAPSAESD